MTTEELIQELMIYNDDTITNIKSIIFNEDTEQIVFEIKKGLK